MSAYWTTTDTYTGKSFRYNAIVECDGWTVPNRESTRGSIALHPHRVPRKLLLELNPGRSVPFVWPPKEVAA